MEDQETGDVQFDDESGEGDSLAVERERDLALSAQARQMVADIDAALARIKDGTYGYSVVSGRPIPKERLRAIPWATELVEEKVGGLGRR
jgi:RNA polymerase-binding transcription factor DksA